MALGRYEDAASAYREYLSMEEKDGGTYNALIGLAGCYKMLEMLNKAHECLLWAIGNDPTRAEAFFHIGELYYEEQEFQKAIPFYQAILGMSPQVTGTFILHYCYGSLPYERIAACNLMTDNLIGGLEMLNMAIDLADPSTAKRLDGVRDTIIERLGQEENAEVSM